LGRVLVLSETEKANNLENLGRVLVLSEIEKGQRMTKIRAEFWYSLRQQNLENWAEFRCFLRQKGSNNDKNSGEFGYFETANAQKSRKLGRVLVFSEPERAQIMTKICAEFL
jgi:hypothetical protein